MKYLITVVIIGLLIILSGCSTAPVPGKFWQYNPQNYQGGTVVAFEQGDINIDWSDFKDKAVLKMSVDLNSDGNMDFIYEASDIVGSTAAQIRADVEKALSEAGVFDPNIIEKVLKAIVLP
mgnify:FL=1